MSISSSLPMYRHDFLFKPTPPHFISLLKTISYSEIVISGVYCFKVKCCRLRDMECMMLMLDVYSSDVPKTQKFQSEKYPYREHLTLSGPGGEAESAPLRFFSHNSKTPGDIEKKLSDFNFTPLTDILRILSITIVVRCCHSNLLFPVCHAIFWVEKIKKLELSSR